MTWDDAVVKGIITKEQLLGFLPFNKWLSALKTSLDRQGKEQHLFHTSPFSLRSITIQSVDFFKPTVIGFVKLNARVENANGKILPGIAFLRGPSVAVLMILQPSDSKTEKWVILTEQPRVAAGSLQFMEVSAGMIDPKSESFAGTAANVIMEKTGFKFPEQKLKDLTKYAIGKEAIWDEDTWDDPALAGSSDDLESAMYPSPGGTDEYIKIFLWEKELERKELDELKKKLAGTKTAGELVTVKIANYEQLWRVAARDSKALAAWSLYEALKRKRHPDLTDTRVSRKQTDI
ncbi:hypothetical protein ACEPPN_010561 [Leptodophora sp. 'Broadleaf-Isolate-01']